MAVFTTRLNLKKPAGGSSGTIPGDDQADIDDLNDNSDKIDAAIGTIRVASSAKPATPYDGQTIALTDANDMPQIRAGTEWKNPGIIGRGTTAQRNAYYPAPGNAAARVALANSFALWFNTEKGWLEQYYAQFDDAGAGRFAKTVHGWAPAADVGEAAVRPGSIAASVGTATLRGAMVEFSGLTAGATLSLNDVFVADFANYRFEIEIDSASALADITARMRLAGVDDAGATAYGTNRIESTTASAGTFNYSSQSSARVHRAATAGGVCEGRVFGPKLAKRTYLFSSVMGSDGVAQEHKTVHGVTTAYDGITFIVAGGTIAGRLRFFGVNDY